MPPAAADHPVARAAFDCGVRGERAAGGARHRAALALRAGRVGCRRGPRRPDPTRPGDGTALAHREDGRALALTDGDRVLEIGSGYGWLVPSHAQDASAPGIPKAMPRTLTGEEHAAVTRQMVRIKSQSFGKGAPEAKTYLLRAAGIDAEAIATSARELLDGTMAAGSLASGR
jgi:hypothetical protein